MSAGIEELFAKARESRAAAKELSRMDIMISRRHGRIMHVLCGISALGRPGAIV
jgi:hypothetical protein